MRPSLFNVLRILFFSLIALPALSQNIHSEWLLGHWDLNRYEIKGKDEQMNLWFDNHNIDSSFTLLLAKMQKEEPSAQALSKDSVNLLKKEYEEQVHYLSKSYFKFFPNGKCKYNMINQHEKFRSEDDTYSVTDHLLSLGTTHQYEIVSLSEKRLVISSNGGKIQLTYIKQ